MVCGVWIRGMEITGLVWIAMKLYQKWAPQWGRPAAHPGNASRQKHSGEHRYHLYVSITYLTIGLVTSLLLLLCLRLTVVANITNAWAFAMEGPPTPKYVRMGYGLGMDFVSNAARAKKRRPLPPERLNEGFSGARLWLNRK